MAAPSKDTIYIDIDDEITAIIDKLTASKGKVVALVLPKRAAVLQSIVNMRLLKRASEEAKKNVVLITSEAGLLPLAGAAGVHVAKTLTSKPEIPTAPVADDDEETVDEDDTVHHLDPEVTAATAGAIAVGALAGLPPTDEVETVELDDEIPAPDVADDIKPISTRAPKKNKKLAVPDFDRFRLLLFGGGFLLILLIVGFIFANNVLPKATITVKTDASNVNVNANFTLSTTATTFQASNNTVPAKLAQLPKTYTQQATATGQKNNGDKATGSVTLSLNDCSQPSVTIPAGTGVSSNGLTFITQQSATLSSVKVGSTCKNNSFPSFSTANVDVKAQTGGAKYNVGAASYTVAGYATLVSATGSAMTGGTDNVVTILTQSDIDGAKAKITPDAGTVKQTLQSQLQQGGYYAITTTYSASDPVITTTANAGDAVANVTVTEVITHSMFGAHESDLKTIVDTEVKKQIDTSKQSILTEGLRSATFTVQSSSATSAQLSMQTTAEVGPQLSEDQIKQQSAGKKPGDVKSALTSNPDVTDVEVKLSPFWVTSVPKKTEKITVTIAKPTTTVNNSNATNP